VLYLAESLLLSGLIVSGVLSERALTSVEISLLPGENVAGETSQERIRIRNRRSTPLFCLEVGEWRGRHLLPLAFLTRLEAKEEAVVRVERIPEARGLETREGFWIATSAPFGFARKVRFLERPGNRIVWPGPRAGLSRAQLRRAEGGGPRGGVPEAVPGEARPFQEGDPLGDVLWTLSARGTGWWVRLRRPSLPEPTVILDRRLPSEGFEANLLRCAQPFLRGEEATLIVRDSLGRRRFHGRVLALNELALLQPENPGANP
jgi:uncharacterized protein (DUF58 family)